MPWIFTALCLAGFGAGSAMTVRESLWHNIMLLCNLVLAATITFGFYQPLVIWVDEWSLTGGQFTYLLDFIVFWLLFGATVSILKAIGRTLSGTKVKFFHPLEKYAAPAVGTACGVVVSCLVAASLHMSPFERGVFGDSLIYDDQTLESPSITDGSPDIAFLGVAELVTNPAGLGGAGEFDLPLWVEDYGDHRESFETAMKSAKNEWVLKVLREENR